MRIHLPCIALVGVLASCESKDHRRIPVTEEVTTTVDDIKAKPTAHYGRTVTVAGEIDEVFSDMTFELEGDGLLWDKQVLVVTKFPVKFGPRNIDDDDEVIVRGTVRPMNVAELERELGRELPTNVVKKFRDQPVLVADSIRLVQTGFRWTEDQSQGAIVSMVRVVSDVAPKALAGTQVHLDDVLVQRKAGRGVWVGPNERWQLFVELPERALPTLATLAVGERVDLEGTLREMPPVEDAMKRFDLDAKTAVMTVAEGVYIDAEAVARSEKPPAS